MNRKLRQLLLLIISMLPCVVAAEGLAAFGELLYLRASEQTASTFAFVTTPPGNTLTNLDESNISFNQHFGFRGGFVFEPECNFYDSKISWTYFAPKAFTRIPVSDQLILSEFFSGFQSLNFFFGATIDWKLKLNILDFDIGHTFHPTPCVSIRPSLGITGGSINQSIHCNWDAVIYVATENLKNNFSGAGPNFGLDGHWNIYKSLSLFGDFKASFLFGHWKINDTYTRPWAVSGLVTPTTITTTYVKNPSLGTLTFKYRLGFEVKYEGKSNLTFQLGYEMQYWPNQLRLPTFNQLPIHGDLTIQGVTCRLLIDF